MKKNVFVIAPHTDDIEISLGGTVHKMVLSEKYEIFYITFSFAEQSLPKGFDSNATRVESKNAALSLGIKEDNIIQFSYTVRRFPKYRQDILEDLIVLKRNYKPSIVFCPSIHDVHQDHSTIANECIRAFKNTCSIYEYETTKNDFISFEPKVLISLSQDNMDAKIRVVECYKSQIIKNLDYKEIIVSLATVRGNMIGSKYAEAFDTHRIIIEEI
jgi:LmbE family N-acetylglucosaminyl deacetylase